MAASIKRTIRKTLVEIIEGKNATTAATPAERLEACRLLWKDLASAQKGKPRGRPFTRKVKASTAERITELVE
jgi:hypothetical protein